MINTRILHRSRAKPKYKRIHNKAEKLQSMKMKSKLYWQIKYQKTNPLYFT